MIIYTKKIFNRMAILFLSSFMHTAIAADQAAKEEITPPPAEGPLTVNQIPPISSTLQTPSATATVLPPTSAAQND